MKLGSDLQFFDNNSVLVNGAAGFLPKIFVEKVLRVQPYVKKLYLLMRAGDAKWTVQRLHSDILGKDLLRELKEKCREAFGALISEKVIVVAGDITIEDLGVMDVELKEQILDHIDVIEVNVALSANTIGAKHITEFAKKCTRLVVLVHVSTRKREGQIQETPYEMRETLNGVIGLDVEEEKRIVNEKLEELWRVEVSDNDVRISMKQLGLRRAKVYGRPNTYVYSKAMGEMLVKDFYGVTKIKI